MINIRGCKVILASEMAQAESQAFIEGASEEVFMQAAGEKVAKSTAEFITGHSLEKRVTLLIGKGNNGGDAFVAGLLLMEKGYEVQAFTIFSLEDCSPLCQVHGAHFQNSGGVIQKIEDFDSLHFSGRGVLLDGLLGTGFKGVLKGGLLKTIRAANRSKMPIVAIDIPSGVDGNTGEVDPEAICAQKTIALGLPKAGCFIKDGYRNVGELGVEDFGLAPKYIDAIPAFGFLIDEKKMGPLLPVIQRDRHKYQAGYVVGISGSKGMGGAAKLASMAALRSGAGITRLFYAPEMEEEMQTAPFEMIREPWNLNQLAKLLEECNKAKAVFIGPGLGRKPEVIKLLTEILPKIEVPCVLDADALYFVANHLNVDLPKQLVMTPHHKEMLRLLHEEKAGADFLKKCQVFADEHQVQLVLKGAPTFVLEPGKDPIIIAHGDPGMATAGTGDVLTGVIAALLSQGLGSSLAAAMGVYLHAISGEIAAREKGSYSLIASDLLDYLPESFLRVSESKN